MEDVGTLNCAAIRLPPSKGNLIRPAKMWKMVLYSWLTFFIGGIAFEFLANTQIPNFSFLSIEEFSGVVTVLVFIVVHELLHGLGFFLAGLKRDDVEFGMNWRRGTAYAHAKEPMSVESFWLAAILPAVVLGFAPFALGIALSSGILGMFSVLMIAGAVGDFCMIWASRGVKLGTLIIDSPTEIGIQVVG